MIISKKYKYLYSFIKILFIIKRIKEIKEIAKNIEDKSLFIKKIIKVIILKVIEEIDKI